MSLYVLKFGGSSVATTARISHVADIIVEFVKKGARVVVVTSAMQGVTNRLIELTKSFTDTPFNREYDAVISSGEQISAGLLALALNSKGISAKSMNAWQIPITASGKHSEACITHISRQKIFETLSQEAVPIVTGFQGILKNGDICTIGRGGSDATACAVAKAINADECFIYTDVDGVYTADPRVVLNAHRLNEVSYDDMIELASWGAKVLQTKSVQIAKEYNVNLRVSSSFSEGEGTKITNQTLSTSNYGAIGIAHNIDMFAIYTDVAEEQNLKLLLEPVKSVVKLFPGVCLIPKTIQSEIQATLSNANIVAKADNDVGTVTVVGNNTAKTVYDAFNVKKTISGTRSQTFVVPLQQTLPLVATLHKTLFEET